MTTRGALTPMGGKNIIFFGVVVPLADAEIICVYSNGF
jgi:hypothetical protein